MIRICQRNCCQSFSKNLLLGTLIINSANVLCISDENIFIQNIYTSYSYLAEFESFTVMLTLSTKEMICFADFFHEVIINQSFLSIFKYLIIYFVLLIYVKATISFCIRDSSYLTATLSQL